MQPGRKGGISLMSRVITPARSWKRFGLSLKPRTSLFMSTCSKRRCRCGRQTAIDVVLDLLVTGQGSDSTLWRSAIEEHQLNVGHDALTSLLITARTLCERACDSPHAAKRVIQQLERRGQPILQRLAIH